jgi:hypothetical protein
VLGIERREFAKRPLISETPELWGLFCLRANEEEPRPVAWHRSEAKAQHWMCYVREQTVWSCTCGQRYEDHQPLVLATFALQRQHDRDRAASDAAIRQPAAPAVTFSETMADPETSLPPPPDPKPPTRGPHAERLERARAVHEAAKKAMPRQPVRREAPKDPFDEEDR